MALLKKMGWSEGKGLGKQETGIVNPLQMKRREDNLGLGFNENDKFKWNNNWWENSYNSAIKGLSLDFEASESEPTNDSSDGEEEEGPNKKRLSRRKNRLNYGKKEEEKEEKKEKKEKKPVVLKKKQIESDDSSSDEEVKTSILPNSKKIQKKQK